MPLPLTRKLDTTGVQSAAVSLLPNVAAAPVPSTRKLPFGHTRVKREKTLTVAPGASRFTQSCAMVNRWALCAQMSKVIHLAPSTGEMGGLLRAASQLSHEK